MGYRPLKGLDIKKDLNDPKELSNLIQNVARLGIGLYFNKPQPLTNLLYCGNCRSPFSFTDDKKPKRCGVCNEDIDWSKPMTSPLQKKCPKCGYVQEYDSIRVCPYEEGIVYLV